MNLATALIGGMGNLIPVALLDPPEYCDRLMVKSIAMRFAIVELIGDILPFAAVDVPQAHDVLVPPRELS